jgi:hypothetical protein
MSYTINHYNDSPLATVSDGTYDQSSTSLTLIGKDLPNYGTFLNENFVYLLENFAGTTQPSNPVIGQLWWDATNNILRVWSGVSWKISTGATSKPFSSPPSDLSALGGDLWFDTTNSQLKVYSGSSWITVGPQASSSLGVTGAFAAQIADTSAGSHVVIQLKFNGVVYAMLADNTAPYNTALTGFNYIVPGLNFSTSFTQGLNIANVGAVASTLVQRDNNGGVTANVITATSINATTITASSTFNGTFVGNVSGNVQATQVSATTVSAQGVTAASGFSGTILTASQPNITGLGNVFNLNTNGTTNLTGAAYLNGSPIATTGGSTTFSSINGTPIGNATPSTGAFTTLSVVTSVTPTVGNVVNLGSSSNWFNNIYGTAIHAQYADLAERFHADAEYLPGTVVEMGGPNEITQVVEDLSNNVFGVISTNAAYLMNSGAGENATHPPIAMSGRVPVRAVGLIAKGDRLVSAGNGIARAGLKTEITPWNVIGRALENKTTEGEALIEAIVKIIS